MGRKKCKSEGCANGAVKGGVCVIHGAKQKRCSNKGCAKRAKKGGLCCRHGGTVKRCSHEGCPNGAVKGGVCVAHGAKQKRCSNEGCAKRAQKGGLCRRHGTYYIASAAQNGAARPPHPAAGYNDARVVVASAIAGGGGGEIEKVDIRIESNTSSSHVKIKCNNPSSHVKMKCNLQKSIMAGPFLNGMTLCPHDGCNYSRGNIYLSRSITQGTAASLNVFRRNQVPSLLYDQSEIGFDPTKWRFCIRSTESARLFLQPFNGDHGDAFSNLVHVHRSNNDDENNFLYTTTSKLIGERNPLRNTNGWNGVGIMVGIGEHIDRNGQHTDFVLKPKFRTRWSNEEEKVTMNKCGGIFEAQFKDKCVGYHEMIEHQKYIWPNKCPGKVTDVPRCWNASQNLGNELHNDNDAYRSFAVWINKNKGLPSKSWYLLFPEWEVAIEINCGTWISWNGKSCGHCTAVPDVVEGDKFLSLFCSIPQSLHNHLIRKM